MQDHRMRRASEEASRPNAAGAPPTPWTSFLGGVSWMVGPSMPVNQRMDKRRRLGFRAAEEADGCLRAGPGSCHG